MGQLCSLSGKLSLWDHLELEINPPIMLSFFVPSCLLFFCPALQICNQSRAGVFTLGTLWGTYREGVFYPCQLQVQGITLHSVWHHESPWKLEKRCANITGSSHGNIKTLCHRSAKKICQMHRSCLEKTLGFSHSSCAIQGQMGTIKVLAELLEGTKSIS